MAPNLEIQPARGQPSANAAAREYASICAATASDWPCTDARFSCDDPLARGCQALVIPALSLSMTWLIVKLAGRCDGGNSTNDWAIWAT
jgi:hypothetical protein